MLLAAGALGVGLAGSAQAVDLAVTKSCLSMPGGAITAPVGVAQTCAAGTIQVWRFKRTDGGPGVAEDPANPVPPGALVIEAAAGDTLTINVSNELAIPVSLAINGQVLANNSGPVWVGIANPYGAPTATVSRPAGDVTSRVRSFAHEAPAATLAGPGEATYVWSGLRTGSYLITSGTHPSLQIPMGLYAALVVRSTAPAGAPYDGEPVPDNEQVLLFSEIDPRIHAAANDLTQSFPGTNLYDPKYFLINGRPFPGGDILPIGAPGESTLLRFLNAGVDTYMPLVQGPAITGIAEDGILIPAAPTDLRLQRPTVELHSGKTMDVTLENPAVPGYIPVYDRRLFLSNGKQTPGGLLAFLEVAAATQRLLAVGKAGTGTGSVAVESLPGGIFCRTAFNALPADPGCSQLYNDGTEVTLVASANPGSLHTGWAVSPANPADRCPNVAGADCIVTMNAAKTVTATFAAQNVVRLITPNGGETIPGGSQYLITWGAPANAVTFRLRYSLNGGRTWRVIRRSVTGTSFVWNVPTPRGNKNACLVQVTGYNAAGGVVGSDVSNARFRIQALTIVRPTTGDVWGSGAGNLHDIEWRSFAERGLVKSITIQYSKDGTTWRQIAGSPLDNSSGAYDDGGVFHWQIVPQVATNRPGSLVRITERDAAGRVVSRAVSKRFTITP